MYVLTLCSLDAPNEHTQVVPGTNHATVTRSDATVQLAHVFFQHRLQLQQTLPKQQMAQASVAEQPQSIQST